MKVKIKEDKIDFLLSFQMGEVWDELQPKLGCLFGGNNGLKPPIWNLNAPSGKRETLPLPPPKRITNWKITCAESYRKLHNFLSFCKVVHFTKHIPFNERTFDVNGFSSPQLILGFDHPPCKWTRQWAHKSAISCSAWWGNNFHFQIKEAKSSKCYFFIREHSACQTWRMTVYSSIATHFLKHLFIA